MIEQTATPTAPASISTSSSMQSLSSNVSNDHVPAAPPPPENEMPVPSVETIEVPGPPVPPPPPIHDEFDEPKCTVLYDFEGRNHFHVMGFDFSPSFRLIVLSTIVSLGKMFESK